MLRTIFVSAITHHALIAVLVAEWFMSYRTSQNVGMRAAVTNLPHFDRYWASGAVVGVCLGLFVTHILIHPHDADLLRPSTWSDWHTISAVKRLWNWLRS
jgi:hypothetical protein